MARREIGDPLDRQNRNNHNHNYIELYDGLIRSGVDAKEALEKVNEMVDIADNALNIANQSKEQSSSTQKQLDDLIIHSGTSDAEVIQARGDEPLLKDRLDKSDDKLQKIESATQKELVKINSDEVEMIGDWNKSNQIKSYKGDLIWSNVSGRSIKYNFNGTGIRVYGLVANDGGKAEVLIDGISHGEIDFYRSSTRYQHLVFEKNNLNQGNHIIEIVVLSNNNPSSSGNIVRIDFLEILQNNWINEEFNTLKDIQRQNVHSDVPLFIPTYDGSFQAMHPKVLYFPDGWNGYKYWMAMTPYTDSKFKTENPSIVVSNADGYAWREPGGISNPVSGIPTENQYDHYSDPHIFMVGNTMELWYRYTPPNANDTALDKDNNIIYRKTSTDGRNWTDRGIVLQGVTSRGIYVSPSIIYESGKYKVYYHDFRGNMYYIESSDLENWTPEEQIQVGVPSEYFLWHSDVIKNRDYYEMVVSCDPDAGANQRYELFYAKSKDGKDFGQAKLILEPMEGDTTPNSSFIYRSSLVYVDGKYKLFYSGRSKDKVWGTFLTEGYSMDSLQGYQNSLSRKYLNNGANIPEDTTLLFGNSNYLMHDKEREKFIIKSEDEIELISETGVVRVAKLGAGTLVIKYLEDPASFALRNTRDDQFFNLSTRGVYFNAGPVNSREGAFRYDATDKKMKYHDGTGWKTLSVD